MSDFSRPCGPCAAGNHLECSDALCGCIVFHPDDDTVTRGFKKIKQQIHPERAQWTAGGFGNIP